MNGYFYLEHTQDALNLVIVPPTEGGEAVKYDEIIAYLQTQSIFEVDNKVIRALVNETGAGNHVRKIGAPIEQRQKEMCVMELAADRMTLTARFYAPSSDGGRLSRTEIIQMMRDRGIRFGFDDDAIAQQMTLPVYMTPIVLAKGQPAKEGHDGSIKYHFTTNFDNKPARNPDGSVDFHSLNTISHCKEGQILAELIKEVKGEPGTTVLGENLQPKPVKPVHLKYGKNVKISEDRMTLYAEINGHVSLLGGKVVVSDVYEVDDVGPSTGNIESIGSVIVNGTVQSGYSIKAHANVEVRGIVEAAQIEAGGNIVLERGMNGMGKGTITAGGSIVSRFFENCTVKSGSYIEADSVLHSFLSATDTINIDGRKGFIAGGSVRATKQVSCRILGSGMGSETLAEVGVDPEQKTHFQELHKEMLELQKNLKQIRPIIISLSQKVKEGTKLTPEQIKYLQQLMQLNEQQSSRLDVVETEYDELDEALRGASSAAVIVKQEAFAGTKISISDASMILKQTVSRCKFVYEKGEIRMRTI